MFRFAVLLALLFPLKVYCVGPERGLKVTIAGGGVRRLAWIDEPRSMDQALAYARGEIPAPLLNVRWLDARGAPSQRESRAVGLLTRVEECQGFSCVPVTGLYAGRSPDRALLRH